MRGWLVIFRTVAVMAAAVYALASGAQQPSVSGEPSAAQHQPHRQRPMDETGSLPRQKPAPIERRPPEMGAVAPVPGGGAKPPLTPGSPQGAGSPHDPKGPHLTEWMRAHSSLSPEEQQQALQREPGFRQLSPETQRRYLNRLAQLNAMPPEARERMLSRTEQMERLTPEQRAQVRSSMLQWGALPPDQKRLVGQAFRELRGLPPPQRLAVLNSRYRNLNPQERFTLQQLMLAESLMPMDHF